MNVIRSSNSHIVDHCGVDQIAEVEDPCDLNVPTERIVWIPGIDHHVVVIGITVDHRVPKPLHARFDIRRPALNDRVE